LLYPILFGLLVGLAGVGQGATTAGAQQAGPFGENCNNAGPVVICSVTIQSNLNAGTSMSISIQGGNGSPVSCDAPSGITCTVSSDNSGATLVCTAACTPGTSFVMVLPSSGSLYFANSGAPASTSTAYVASSSSSGGAYSATVGSPPTGAITVGNDAPSSPVQITISTQPSYGSSYSGCGGYTVVVSVSCSPGYYGGGGGLCVNGSVPVPGYGCTAAVVPYYAPIAIPYGNSCSGLLGGSCGNYYGYGCGGFFFIQSYSGCGCGYGGFGGSYGSWGSGCNNYWGGNSNWWGNNWWSGNHWWGNNNNNSGGFSGTQNLACQNTNNGNGNGGTITQVCNINGVAGGGYIGHHH
jgi:hypothetical protein